MGFQDKKNENDRLSEHQRASLWEYGLIVAGLAIVVVFGTQSIGRTVREPYAKTVADPTTTASISPRKPDSHSVDPAAPVVVRP